MVSVHFADEDVEMDHYANGHTDGDSVVHLAHANVVDVGDVFWSKGNVPGRCEKEIADAGLPKIWNPRFAPETVPPERDFMQEIYATATHTNDLNQ